MWIPDIRWEEPNLLTPGRIPVGDVEINRANPLSRGLTLAVLFRTNFDTLVPSGKIMAFRPQPWRLHGTSNLLPERGLVSNGGKDGLELRNYPLQDGSFSVLVEATAESFAGSERALLGGDSNLSAARNFQFRVTSAGAFQFIRFIGGAAKTITAASTIATNRSYQFGGVHESGRAAVYLDGNVDGTASDAGDMDTDSANYSIGMRAFRSVISSDSDFGEAWNGSIRHAFAWNRALSDAEMRAMSLDPYQLLMPA